MNVLRSSEYRCGRRRELQSRYAGLDDDPTEFFDVPFYDGREFLRRVANHLQPQLPEAIARLRRLQRLRDGALRRAHAGGGRFRRREQSIPELDVESGYALLGKRRHVRQNRRALAL